MAVSADAPQYALPPSLSPLPLPLFVRWIQLASVPAVPNALLPRAYAPPCCPLLPPPVSQYNVKVPNRPTNLRKVIKSVTNFRIPKKRSRNADANGDSDPGSPMSPGSDASLTSPTSPASPVSPREARSPAPASAAPKTTGAAAPAKAKAPASTPAPAQAAPPPAEPNAAHRDAAAVRQAVAGAIAAAAVAATTPAPPQALVPLPPKADPISPRIRTGARPVVGFAMPAVFVDGAADHPSAPSPTHARAPATERAEPVHKFVKATALLATPATPPAPIVLAPSPRPFRSPPSPQRAPAPGKKAGKGAKGWGPGPSPLQMATMTEDLLEPSKRDDPQLNMPQEKPTPMERQLKPLQEVSNQAIPYWPVDPTPRGGGGGGGGGGGQRPKKSLCTRNRPQKQATYKTSPRTAEPRPRDGSGAIGQTTPTNS